MKNEQKKQTQNVRIKFNFKNFSCKVKRYKICDQQTLFASPLFINKKMDYPTAQVWCSWHYQKTEKFVGFKSTEPYENNDSSHTVQWVWIVNFGEQIERMLCVHLYWWYCSHGMGLCSCSSTFQKSYDIAHLCNSSDHFEKMIEMFDITCRCHVLLNFQWKFSTLYSTACIHVLSFTSYILSLPPHLISSHLTSSAKFWIMKAYNELTSRTQWLAAREPWFLVNDNFIFNDFISYILNCISSNSNFIFALLFVCLNPYWMD